MGYQVEEVGPDDPRARLITEMVQDLGWCINSYSQLEYLAADMLWIAWDLPEYLHLNRPLSQGLDGRIAHLRLLFDAPGRLQPHRDDVLLLLDRLKELSEPRHLFVHGHTQFVYTPGGDAALFFRRFVPPPKGGEWTKIERIVRPEQLRHARWVWCVLASTAQRIIGDIYIDLGLEDPGRGGSITDSVAGSQGAAWSG